MKNSIYYDFEGLLTKNALINMTLSNRGAGKTYGFTKWAIKDFLRSGKQFVYLRRYGTELKNCDKFFNAIVSNKEFEHHTFYVTGGKDGGEFLIDNKVAGFYAPLSKSLVLKSVPFPEVNKICFDEFLIPRGTLHYLKNEVINFFDFIETVNRYRDSEKLHDLVRVFCFANNISIVNPYFSYFNIQVDTTKRFNIYKKYNNDLIVEIYKNQDFVKAKKETRLGAIMAKTPYGDYAIDGEFYQDNDAFICKRSIDSRCVVILKYADTEIGFWFAYKEGRIYASKLIDQNADYKYTLTSIDLEPNYFLVNNANQCPHMVIIKNAFQNGCLFFEDLAVKDTVYKMLQCLSVRGK